MRIRLYPSIALLTLTLCAFSLTACDKDRNSSPLDEISKQMGSAYDSARKEVTSRTEEEIEKLFNFEYKVVEIDRGNSAEQLQDELNKLGQDRWDCFHAETADKTLKMFCKRRPKSYLRYLIPSLL